MSAPAPDLDPDQPAAPDIDDQGIDRQQIRDMLALSPEQRLRVIEEHLTGLLAIRAAHEARAVR